MAHSPLAPSASHRWLKCMASPFMEKNLPEETSKYAAEGTAAHEIMAQAAHAYLSSFGRMGEAEAMATAIAGVSVTDAVMSSADPNEMMSCVKMYLEEIARTFYLRPDQWGVEETVDLTYILDTNTEAHGTVDCYIQTGRVLHVIDYKHGQGVLVAAKGNPQLSLYALAILDTEKFEGVAIDTVVLHIVQPRAGGVSRWDISPQALDEWLFTIAQPAARRAMSIYNELQPPTDENFLPDENTCRFCKAKKAGTCTRLEAAVFDVVQLPAEPVATAEPAKPVVPDDMAKLAWLYSQKGLVKQFFDEVEARMYATLVEGGSVPGFKLVQGKPGNRAWKDKDEAEQVMRRMRIHMDDMYDRKLISPTSAEKLFKSGKLGPRKWTELQGMIVRPEGKPMIAPESDKREALEFKPFEEIGNDGPEGSGS